MKKPGAAKASSAAFKGVQAARKRRAYRDGRLAEFWAAVYLRLCGYRLLARRFKTPVGEIDIIARRGNGVIYVEVKKRASFGQAAEAITPRQQSRISRAALWHLGKNPEFAGLELRLDAIVMGRFYLLRHIKNAWTL